MRFRTVRRDRLREASLLLTPFRTLRTFENGRLSVRKLAGGVCALGSRVLVLFLAVLVAVMPLTEYFFHFDGFPVANQDFELGTLAIVTILGLLLVMLQQGGRGLRLIWMLRRWLRRTVRDDFRGGASRGSRTFMQGSAQHLRPLRLLLPGRGLEENNFPLKI